MQFGHRIILPLFAAVVAVCALPDPASAGPLLDWWRGKHNPPPVAVAQPTVTYAQACCDVSACCNPCDAGCNTCTPGFGQPGSVQQQVVNFAPNFAAASSFGTVANTAFMPAASFAPTTAFVPTNTVFMPATTTAFAPATTAVAAPQFRFRGFFPRYRTAWARVPVTSYRPVSTIDPTSGMTVAMLQPCATYNWQLRRVPVTALNPAYYASGVSYAQPNTGAVIVQGAQAGGCSSCGVSTSTTTAPYYGPTPATTIPAGPAGTFGPAETAPADLAPSLNQGANYRREPSPSVKSQVKSVVQPAPVGKTKPSPAADLGPGVQLVPDPDAPVDDEKNSPDLNNPRDLTAQLGVRRTWAYTPVSWAQVPENEGPAIAPAVQASPAKAKVRQEEVKWDASGWKSIAK